MKKINLSLPDILNQRYSVTIGKSILKNLENLIDLSAYSSLAIISDMNLKTHLDVLKKHLTVKPTIVILGAGEKYKNIKSLETIWQKLAEAKFDKKSLVINLGGGVVCDIGGLAASTYMRGIDFINIPTTVLSQVDASIGGKTAIDFSGFKNKIGSFQQPKAVFIDVNTLSTLPNREFISGFGEIIKHGIVKDAKYFQKVTAKKPKSFSENDLIEIIHSSCRIKKEIVEKDPTEKNIRIILHFGHIVGHAVEELSLETETPFFHGEAVSIGMVAESKISNLIGLLSDKDFEIIKNTLHSSGLPINTIFDSVKIIQKIIEGKKDGFEDIKWILPKSVGEVIYNQKIAGDIVSKAIESIKA